MVESVTKALSIANLVVGNMQLEEAQKPVEHGADV